MPSFKHYFVNLFSSAKVNHADSEALDGMSSVDYRGEWLKHIPSNRVLAIGGGLGAFSLLILFLALHRDNSHVVNLEAVQNQHAQNILRELKDIHTEFQTLQSNPQSSEALKESLVSISTNIDKAQAAILTMQNDMDSKMQDIQQAVNNNPNTRQYLDVKNLPFKVISVDVISQQPFVSVNYSDHVTPLGIGDTLGGWILVNADYDKATAIFRNDRDQYVQAIIQN